MKITLRFPTAAYAYAEVTVEGDSGAELEARLGDVQRAAGLAIQLTGGGDSAALAERLLKEELGAVRIQEDGSPWTQPQAPAQQPWAAAPEPSPAPQGFAGPPTPSAGPPPFGAPAPQAQTNAFGASAPALRSPVIKNMPRVPDWDKANWKDPQSPEGKQVKLVTDSGYMAGSKLKWAATRTGFGFETPASGETLAYLRANLPAIGASLEE